MKEIILAAVLLVTAAALHLQMDDNRKLINAHHAYVRRTELKQAEMCKREEKIETRLATLERIGIELHVIGQEGIWAVSGVEVTR